MGQYREIRLSVSRPDVLDEVFDGEAVVVNLRTGRYFAFDAPATQIWKGILAERPWPALADELADEHDADPDAARALVGAFAQQLIEHELVVADAPLPTLPDTTTSATGSLRPASLQVFTDMEDLLLLDPIHDIDLEGTGWPQAPSAASG